jgi:hypothetical protein
MVLILAALSGIAQALDNAVSRSAGDTLPLSLILSICLIGGPLGGLVSLYLFGALLRWTGSWLGGTGTAAEVRAAIAWSAVPTTAGLLLWLPMLALLGVDMFTSFAPQIVVSPLVVMSLSGFTLLLLALSIWNVALSILCLAEAHRFSGWHAFGAWLLAILLFTVPVLLLALLVILIA